MSSEPPAWEQKTEQSVESFAKVLNVISAAWIFSVAALILFDVVGREVFASPFHGTNEIVSNSVLAILMLQLPLSILNRSSLRTTIVYGKVRAMGKGIIDSISYLLAGLLFLAIAIGSWSNMVESWEILEQEGSGIVEIPVYPIRTLVVFVGFFGVAVCSLLIYHSLKRPEDFDHSETTEIGE
ncbi:MAG: TRAP transporter small permease [Rhodospirillales bacterium]|jgi:TRAP-type C4-dicarboxylate transport system permease small subunit|nr:TRAP transporter small permease [Rhodospirillales bacterium]MDP7424305.1 TRAP transporter small permease [Rhodospirillales bacterium]MDP7624132.1 TRAP transporter small permease [Rhodospirillales bacterium]HJO86053.1 TRAP transporter small permease [Rhodospirillales bacterium]|tara:strand:+ start:468 stop:1016 length:549 start_codon:yes stop_codon:yes gene_type:complete